LTKVEFPKDAVTGHYYLPIRIYGKTDTNALFTSALVDTGATKCMIPTIHNDKVLNLPVLGMNHDVRVAGGSMAYPYVSIPRIVIAKVEFPPIGSMVVTDTDLGERNVETWLGDTFVVGMNFLGRFDVALKKRGVIIVET